MFEDYEMLRKIAKGERLFMTSDIEPLIMDMVQAVYALYGKTAEANEMKRLRGERDKEMKGTTD